MHYTTIEQSKKLVELGLNPDTADMYWKKSPILNPKEKWIPRIINNLPILFGGNDIIPCWSLGALIDLMPKIQENDQDGGCYPVLCKGWDNGQWHCVYRSSIYITKWHDNSIDAAFEMVCWLLKNGYIKKGNKMAYCSNEQGELLRVQDMSYDEFCIAAFDKDVDENHIKTEEE